jgi:cytochrome c556
MMKPKVFDWRSTGKVALCVLGTAVLLAGCSANVENPSAEQPAAAAQPATPAFKPVVSFNTLMVTMIDNAGHVVWDVEKEGFAPKDEADWLEVEDHAIQLAAAGSLIQMGGTGPEDSVWVQQADWQTHAQGMTSAALAVLSAAKSRDLEKVIQANGELTFSCEGCHKAFKPDLPTEGLLHQRPHSESHETNR